MNRQIRPVGRERNAPHHHPSAPQSEFRHQGRAVVQTDEHPLATGLTHSLIGRRSVGRSALLGVREQFQGNVTKHAEGVEVGGVGGCRVRESLTLQGVE